MEGSYKGVKVTILFVVIDYIFQKQKCYPIQFYVLGAAMTF